MPPSSEACAGAPSPPAGMLPETEAWHPAIRSFEGREGPKPGFFFETGFVRPGIGPSQKPGLAEKAGFPF